MSCKARTPSATKELAALIRDLAALPGVQMTDECPWRRVFEVWPGPLPSLADASIVERRYGVVSVGGGDGDVRPQAREQAGRLPSRVVLLTAADRRFHPQTVAPCESPVAPGDVMNEMKEVCERSVAPRAGRRLGGREMGASGLGARAGRHYGQLICSHCVPVQCAQKTVWVPVAQP